MTQKINYINIKNFKGIKDVEVKNPGRFVAVFGENGAGKTSFIDGIKASIKAERGTNQKVRIGEEDGEITVEFEDFKIKRIIGKRGLLTVEHNGELVPKPQNRLDEVFKGVIGDPNKFLSLHSKEKVKYLLETQGKIDDYNELEEKRMPLFEKRKDIHRTYLAKKDEVDKTDTSEFSDITTGFDEVEYKKLEKELEDIEKHNEEYYRLQSVREKGENQIHNYKQRKKESEDRIKQLQEELKKEQEHCDRVGEAIVEYTKEVDSVNKELEGFTKKENNEIIEKMREMNKLKEKGTEGRTKKEMYERQVKMKNELHKQRRDLDNQVREIEGNQNKLIEKLNIQYKLKLEDGVMYAEVDKTRIPLDELNRALQIEIGVDICLNGPNKIKIITIEDANTLDPNTLNRIKEKIEAIGAQCFIETVYNTGHEEIRIEDGFSKEMKK